MKQAVLRFLRDEEGATAIEYGLIAGLIAVVLVVVLGDLGGKIKDVFNAIIGGLEEVPASSNTPKS